MHIAIDTSTLDAFQKLWSRAPQITEAEMRASLVEANFLVLGELQQQLPKGAGATRGGAGLANSLFAVEEPLQGGFIGIVATNLAYAEPVEVGTRPHMPPVTPIVDWVTAKLGLSGKGAISAAWAIAMSIAKKGTRGRGTWKRVAEQVAPEVQRKFLEAINRILDRLGSP